MAPTEEVWEEHKDKIRGLFLQFSLVEVMKHMSRDYSFVARSEKITAMPKDWSLSNLQQQNSV